MLSGAFTILWIIWIVVFLVLYHKVFSVYYFNLGKGLLREFIIAALLALVMTAITLKLWYIAVVVILLLGLSMMKKMDSKAPLIAAIILAVAMAVIGISAKTDGEAKSTDNETSKTSEKSPSSEDNVFMTEKEKEEMQKSQAEEERLQAEREEYTENHVVTLDTADPLDAFSGDMTCYDITEQLGLRDESTGNVSYFYDVYKNAVYEGLSGELTLCYYYDSSPQGDIDAGYAINHDQAPNHIESVKWTYASSEENQCVELMEKLVSLYEEMYGDYSKESTKTSTSYVWGNRRLSYEESRGYYVNVFKDMNQSPLSEEERNFREEIFSSSQQYVQDFVYAVDNPYTTILEGDYLNENGDKVTVQLNPDRLLEGQCLISFRDMENRFSIENLEGMNEEYSFLLSDYYGDGLYVSFYVVFAEDFSKLYVLQSGYPDKNYAGVYEREGKTPVVPEQYHTNEESSQGTEEWQTNPEYAPINDTYIGGGVILNEQAGYDIVPNHAPEHRILLVQILLTNISDYPINVTRQDTDFPIRCREGENTDEIYPLDAYNDEGILPQEYSIDSGMTYVEYWVYEIPSECKEFSIYYEIYNEDGTIANSYWSDFSAEDYSENDRPPE